ncbi:MAG TPA: redox-sensing transcriptional repressor Rex [Phycisphaerae bacterium]|nr:redox-sensing transcriptional repressor Rex [Phycisphaerae bacterium]
MSPPDRERMPDNEAGRPVRDGRVPIQAVRRLSLYLRELEALVRKDRQTISSRELGDLLSLTDAQVRKDLAYFGQFGHPGVGYRVDELIARIRSILGTDRTWRAVLVGAGHLGTALLSYRGFFIKGFQIVAAFDSDPAKIGRVVGVPPGLEILPLDRIESTISEKAAEMAILCVPSEVAQDLADRLVAAGIRGILNFAPQMINVTEDVSVGSVDLAQRLEQLAFHISANRLADDKIGR